MYYQKYYYERQACYYNYINIYSNWVGVQCGLSQLRYLEVSTNQTVTGTIQFLSLPNSNIKPKYDTQLTNKKYVDAVPTTYAGYDATKTQVLKNINGTLTWVTEE